VDPPAGGRGPHPRVRLWRPAATVARPGASPRRGDPRGCSVATRPSRPSSFTRWPTRARAGAAAVPPARARRASPCWLYRVAFHVLGDQLRGARHRRRLDDRLAQRRERSVVSGPSRRPCGRGQQPLPSAYRRSSSGRSAGAAADGLGGAHTQADRSSGGACFSRGFSVRASVRTAVRHARGGAAAADRRGAGAAHRSAADPPSATPATGRLVLAHRRPRRAQHRDVPGAAVRRGLPPPGRHRRHRGRRPAVGRRGPGRVAARRTAATRHGPGGRGRDPRASACWSSPRRLASIRWGSGRRWPGPCRWPSAWF
jgi:hypothetical protein